VIIDDHCHAAKGKGLTAPRRTDAPLLCLLGVLLTPEPGPKAATPVARGATPNPTHS
jgi:hypothetical protein